MLILGVDPGLNRTGLGLIESNHQGFKLIYTDCIATSSKSGILQRLKKIYSELLRIVQEKKPDVLVIEKLYVHHRHLTTAFLLGHARGVICLVCALQNIKLQEYPKTRVDKAVVGKGNASKAQTQKMIQNIFHLAQAPQPEDIADALSLAVAHAYIIRQSNILGAALDDRKNLR